MGVVETALHSDPVRTITSTNVSHSEEISRSFSMENGDHSFLGPPKYRRRKVSAIRDFPLGCESSSGLKNETPLLPNDLHSVVVATQKEGLVPVSVENLMSPLERPIVVPVPDGIGLKKCVAGTIENSICIGESSSGLKNETPLLPNDLHPEVVATQKEGLVPVSVENLTSPLERPSVVAVPDGIGLKKSVASTIENPIHIGESSSGLKNETPLLPNDLHLVVVATQKEEFVPVSVENLTSPLERLIVVPVPDGIGLKKSAARKYPPRRSVSAIRHFPPSCGRNAPRIIKEESQKVVEEKLESSICDRISTEPVEKLESSIPDKISSELVEFDIRQTEEDVQGGISNKAEPRENDSEVIGDKVQAVLEGHTVEEMRKQGDYEIISDILVELQDTKEACTEAPFERKLFWWDHEFETVVENNKSDGCLEEKLNKDIVVYTEEKNLDEKVSDVSCDPNQLQIVKLEDLELREEIPGEKISDMPGQNQLQVGDFENLELGDKIMNEEISVTSGCQNQVQLIDFNHLESASERTIVHGLAGSNCPWRQGKVKGPDKSKPAVCISGSKGKKHDDIGQLERTKTSVRKKADEKGFARKSLRMIPAVTEKDAFQNTGQLVIWEKKDSLQRDEEYEHIHVARKSCGLEVCVPPHHFDSSSSKGHGSDSIVTRSKVRETLRLFQAICRKLLQDEESKSKGVQDGKSGKSSKKRVDLEASNFLRKGNKFINTGKQIIGVVPGVEVGDEFQYRVELIIIGLHRPLQGGIDYVKHGGKVLATSVVASGGYDDDLDDSDVLIYTGQGGNVMNSDKEPEDQKLERGNLALKNSIDDKNPVRVIRRSESVDGKYKTYVYDGLYLVEKCWQDLGPHGKLVFKFQLERIPEGKEVIPICAVNTIDDEKPPPFCYITSMIYPNLCLPIPPKGCDCIVKCSDSQRCSCAVKNRGEIPYNYNGAIVEAKSLVYECGPSCRCAPFCHNRVGQHGIKFQLEVFKTETRGWGVRSLNSISSGSFICEYIGELLEEKEAEQRTGTDEYLFDIGNNYNDYTPWDGVSNPKPEDASFTIDAAQYGNVGRFINHSCTPNLYAQNVLYDHDDKRIPHIMLFAAENIPPLQELTYHYNYIIDQVRDSKGNIKKKSCHCGSSECTGRMY
ncbi:hypothetical protein FNV43_RR08964 [Rhamnella rubrinervis]|uniref:Uncharacterized protein n=1 Tax=Rhamnella rubrinervis TaxID=2594499 RepID=A0A8K0MJE6_9ROSA|nr:hypothetical protein FNV43_RR08964 [Rhamnella rubrinervis]